MMRMMLIALLLAVVASDGLAGTPFLEIDSKGGGITNLKALEVGDIVTVMITETASGNATAKTDANSKTEVSGGPGLGILSQVTDWGLTAENKFAGDGKSTRTGALQASISTRVVEELENDNLRLAGERRVSINGEEQLILLTGIVRRQDVRANNTIASTYIADAMISYNGNGPVADAHSPGLLSRIANFLF